MKLCTEQHAATHRRRIPIALVLTPRHHAFVVNRLRPTDETVRVVGDLQLRSRQNDIGHRLKLVPSNLRHPRRTERGHPS